VNATNLWANWGEQIIDHEVQVHQCKTLQVWMLINPLNKYGHWDVNVFYEKEELFQKRRLEADLGQYLAIFQVHAQMLECGQIVDKIKKPGHIATKETDFEWSIMLPIRSSS